jgi:D-glycero-D-manno-heptose 1,7-bisphosphate phosphatase
MLEKYKINTNTPNISLKCVIGLDRDGVINEDLGTYVTSPRQFSPISGSLNAIAELRKKGYQIVIITNQGGIEKGLMTEDDVNSVHSYMLELLGNAGCSSIDGIYYSASSNKKDPYAKPNVGMFKQCESHNKLIKFNQGFYVGDKLSDLKAAIKIGARPVLVRTGYGIETEKELNKYTYKHIKEKTYIFDTLADFAANLD